MKTCGKCREAKELNEFYKDSRNADGRMSPCKDCRNELAAKKYRETGDEWHKNRSKKHREWRSSAAGKKSNKRYKQSDAGKAAEKRYAKSPKGRASQRRSNSSLKGVRRVVRYLMTEKGKASRNVRSQRRLAKKMNTKNTLTQKEWLSILKQYDSRCAYCYEKLDSPTQDHVVPLSKGGGYTRDNIVPACGSCNSSKGSKSLLMWMNYSYGR